MAVARSRLSCADSTEQKFWSTPTWARAGDTGTVVLRGTAEAAFARSKHVPPDRLADVSLFIDLHLAALAELEALVARGEKDDVATVYKAGCAPEQLDPRDLTGHYCGCLRHSDTIVRALTRSLSGRRVTSDLLIKAASPDEARVRYVDTNALESVGEPDGLVRRLITMAAFGGLPGVREIADIESRIKYWDDPAGLVRLIISKLAKRGVLLALAESISRLPCALLRDVVTVEISGGTCAAIFSTTTAPKKCIRVSRPGVVPESRPGCADWPTTKPTGIAPSVVLDSIVKFGTLGSTAIPTTADEMQMLSHIVSRIDSVRVRRADPAVRKAQIASTGIAVVNFCTSCHCVHGVSPIKTSKAQRVNTMFGAPGPRCSGCGSGSVVRLDLAGRVLDFKTPKGRALFAPCSECAQVCPIAEVYGAIPFCEKHATDAAVADLEAPGAACAICDVSLHGEASCAVIECEDSLHKVCSQCHSILPTTRWTTSELQLLRSRKG